ncbi:MAG: flagellar export chaperone FliS [Desulfurivibrionaceae bacterium]
MYQALKAYQQTRVQSDVNPVKLIHMAYEGILTSLEKAEEGIDEGNVRKRGENLSKAIGLITELNVAVGKGDPEDETVAFLRGLYESILVELPQVSLNEDKEILHRTSRYITRLKEIWENTVMREQMPSQTKEQTTEASHMTQQPPQGKAGARSGLNISI